MTIEKRRLGRLLIDAGVLTKEQLEEVLSAQADTQGPKPKLGSIIAGLGFAHEEDIAQAVADQLGLPYTAKVAPDPSLVTALPRRLAEHYLLLPVERAADGLLVLAMADPSNPIALDDVRVATGETRIRRVVATSKTIRDAIGRAYGYDTGSGDEQLRESADYQRGQDEDDELIRQQTDSAPIVQLVNSIFGDAVRARATDIHVEPQREELRVRYRVDGVMREAQTLSKRVQAAVISRIKILSGMDIAERRRPQDGRGRILVEDRRMDTRVSTIPTPHGEKATIRLLPEGKEFVPLEGLGMDDQDLKLVQRYIQMPQGLIVFTGPTGSGKTTSMYAALETLRGPDRNIVTLEDPIEYQMEGVNQVQIDEKTGITFSRGLRALLRQDPDVILVGEIRDAETARIAIQAAMTGHLVLSTIHTNDAPSAVTRFIDIGVEPFLLGSALTLVVAQRLIRLACTRCSAPVVPSERHIQLLGLPKTMANEDRFVFGTGCEACEYTGYRGRRGVYELLRVTSSMRELISSNPSTTSVSQMAKAAGMRTLRTTASELAFEGISTLDEVVRVTHFEGHESLTCPSCIREVEREFVICPYCRTSLGKLTCRSCGRPAHGDWTGCPYCGQPFDTELSDEESLGLEGEITTSAQS